MRNFDIENPKNIKQKQFYMPHLFLELLNEQSLENKAIDEFYQHKIHWLKNKDQKGLVEVAYGDEHECKF